MEVSVRNVNKVFSSGEDSEFVALKDVSFSMEASEIVSIVGPSGCGKSTLLKMLAGFESPTSGSVEVRDRRVRGPGRDRGVVFQQPALFPWLNLFDNVAFGPKHNGVPRASYTEDANSYIQAVGLEGFEKRFPYQLSGGMKQRAQIARVLINKPKVLLMDEPFGALDFQTRLAMQDLLLRLWEAYQPSLLFITHDVEEAIFLSTRVIVMSVRPGSILEMFSVPFKRPRVYKELTRLEDFVQMKIRILDLLNAVEVE